MAHKAKFLKAKAVPYWALVAFLILTFLTGGASRADVQSLIILRPAAVIFCGIGLWSLQWEHVKAYRFFFGMAAAIFALVLSHLIPLPPSIWGALPGRGIITEVDKASGLGAVWRPVSMVPSATWNAFYSLFVPLAVLLLGAQLDREERFKLLPWVLGLGLFSGFWGILQVVGDRQGPLYLYDVTNNGSAVGLFANRNHQAILLASLFPMLGVYASSGVKTNERVTVRGLIALSGGAVLIPLLLVTGSRAGLIAGMSALASIPLLYRRPATTVQLKRKGDKPDLRWLLGILAILFLAGLTVIMSRAEALQRIMASDQLGESRFLAWQPIAQMAWKYFPFGSGIGSLVEIYQIDENYELLDFAYLNHAHNDWLEVYLTAGFSGLILLGLAFVALTRGALAALRVPLAAGRAVSFARLGATTILILALGSIGDYPLRAPSLACVFVIAALWLAGDRDQSMKIAGSR